MAVDIDPKLLAVRLRSRPDGRKSGLNDEEIDAVIRALELGVITIDDSGRLHNPTMRSPKAGGYEFADADGLFVAWAELATEVLTVVRLMDHGWPAQLIKMEHTPFDVCAFSDTAGGVVIATEEKHSPDDARSLVALMRRCARRRLGPGDQATLEPADRQDFPKYLGLRGLTPDGLRVPPPEWFVVSAPSVWRTFTVSTHDDHATLEETDPGDLLRPE